MGPEHKGGALYESGRELGDKRNGSIETMVSRMEFVIGLLLLSVGLASADVNQCSRTACTNSNDGSCTGALVFNFWSGNNTVTRPVAYDSNGLIQRPPDVCQYGWQAFDGRCFAYSLGTFGARTTATPPGLGEASVTTWANAEAICAKAVYSADAFYGGSHLASVHTLRENCFLHEIIAGHPMFQVPTTTPTTGPAILVNDKRSFNDRNGCHSNNLGGGGSLNAQGTCWIGLDQKAGTEGIAYGWNDLTKYDRRPQRNNGFTPWAGSSSAASCWNPTTGDMNSCSYYYEPNNIAGGTEDCTQIWDRDGTQGEWNDEPCTNNYPYFCSKIARCRPGYSRTVVFNGMPVRKNMSIFDFGIDSRLYNMGVCSQCAPGKYHPQDSINNYESDCSFCNAGRYGIAGEITAQCTATCPPGSYCPIGTGVTSIPSCPAGTYNPNTGASSISACLNAPPGQW